VEVTAVQDFGGHRVEKGFGQFGLVVIDQQANEMQLDLMPDLHGLLMGLEFALQAGGALFDAQVVKRNAFTLGALLTMPVGGFKAVLGARRFGPEQAVMVVEAIHHGFGDIVGQGGVESLRKHAVSPWSEVGSVLGLQCLVARTPALVQGPQGMVVSGGDFFGVFGGDRHVLQQAVVQTIHPAVHDHALAALPGVGDHGGAAHVARLLEHIEFHQRVHAQAFF
jgi:hypothetical protein